jgi:hypothetical protein
MWMPGGPVHISSRIFNSIKKSKTEYDLGYRKSVQQAG